jgi:Na+-driven multidrug efflux pump
MKKFFPFFLPVTTTAIGRVSGYIAMSNVVSTLGTVEMAAQQIILAFFLCFVPICDSISLTAQSFTPGIFEKKENCVLEHHSTLGKMVMNFIKVGIGCGILLFALVSCVPMVSYLFTQDFLVQQSMKIAIPYVAGYFALSGLVCAGEGLLLGQKDLSFMGRAYTVYFFAVPYFLLRLKNITSQQTGVVSMWKIFFIYQTIRTSTWLARLFYLRRKDDAAIALHHTI